MSLDPSVLFFFKWGKNTDPQPHCETQSADLLIMIEYYLPCIASLLTALAVFDWEL
jgi:hypothetical protein